MAALNKLVFPTPDSVEVAARKLSPGQAAGSPQPTPSVPAPTSLVSAMRGTKVAGATSIRGGVSVPVR